jgi:hypothetical protein
MKLYQNLNVTGSLTLSGSLNTIGTITATTLVVQTITSSISSITGSTNFGSLSTNTHVFTGSLYVTGGLNVTTGSVGIGTNNPTTKLHVVGSTGLPATIGSLQSGSLRLQVAGYGTILDFGAEGPATGKQWIQATNASDLSVTYPLLINPNGGNVGIGTTNPSQRLEVSGTDNNNLIMSTTTTGAGGTFRIQANEAASYLVSNNARPLYIQTNSTTAMTITSDRKVGINTTSPQYLFNVAGGRANLPYICSNQFIAGQISGNLNAVNSPNFILLFNMTDNPAGWSCSGTVNAAAWDCWNISTMWIRKLNGGTTANAGITGLYKSGCDFAICDITYNSKRWLAFRFTSNPEIDVMLTGYGLNTEFSSDGSAQVVYSGVTVNSLLASY